MSVFAWPCFRCKEGGFFGPWSVTDFICFSMIPAETCFDLRVILKDEPKEKKQIIGGDEVGGIRTKCGPLRLHESCAILDYRKCLPDRQHDTWPDLRNALLEFNVPKTCKMMLVRSVDNEINIRLNSDPQHAVAYSSKWTVGWNIGNSIWFR